MSHVSESFFILPPLLAEGVSPYAISLFGEKSTLSFFTNSFLLAGIVLGVLLWVSRKATSNMQLIPHGWQNGFEGVVEFLYGKVEDIIGPKVAKRAFPLLASVFMFVLVSNWFGLIPGVGTIGWGQGSGNLTLSSVHAPLFRPATADLNMTLGIALSFMIVWLILTISEVGVIGFLKHMFAPKGKFKGIMMLMMGVIFAFVGLIEVVSIAFRPMSLSLRLYGNIYAGETLLHTMMSILHGAHPVINFIGSILIPLPFYFMELLVGLLQAVVFTLLCSVYILLSTAHDEEHDEHH
ncbi:F0F1 ATP synthase subunit A [Verrucomicrobium spinosum]|uniref:F0F1 ATP synthase subunit A n=1 Tax=Verrucomicrobium spinosum TaxID=2736 RepID=UPI000174658A|nr:F0F1 ATP synthase subunit A [Verrucomicrobium spinosum]